MQKRLIVFLFPVLTVPCFGYTAEGHAHATQCAIELSSDQLPDFFIAGAPAIAHCSADPDVFKVAIGTGQLKKTESPEHYIDLELLKGGDLPECRSEYARLCEKNNATAEKVGTLPYAILDWTQRLTLAFAEHRKWPENQIIQAKCLIYAGNLAHYAQDLCMPLHTTIHHDGMVTDVNTPSPRTGIHLKVDALLHKIPGSSSLSFKSHTGIVPFDSVRTGILKQLGNSHSLVPKVYELESSMPKLDEPLEDSATVHFAGRLLEETARFTSQLFLTAWNDSEGVKLPSWHRREQTASLYKNVAPKKENSDRAK